MPSARQALISFEANTGLDREGVRHMVKSALVIPNALGISHTLQNDIDNRLIFYKNTLPPPKQSDQDQQIHEREGFSKKKGRISYCDLDKNL